MNKKIVASQNETIETRNISFFTEISGVLQIGSEISKKENLEHWLDHDFNLKTAGYRETVNSNDINDPKVGVNTVKMAIIAEARARTMVNRNVKGNSFT